MTYVIIALAFIVGLVTSAGVAIHILAKMFER